MRMDGSCDLSILDKFFRKLNFRKYDFLKYISYIKFKQPTPKKIYKNIINLQYEFLKNIKQKIYKYYKASVLYLIGTTFALIIIYLIMSYYLH